MRNLVRDFFGAPPTDDVAPDDPRPPQKPDIELPDDFEDEQSFLQHMRKEYYDDISADRLNREAGLEDLRFVIGDQWEDYVRQRREAARKPVLSVNRLPAFVAQIVGARRLNETNIKILPDTGGTKDVAKVREDIIRNIQKESRADIAYDKSLENAAMCAIGNFALELDYECDDVFEQKMVISPRNDAFSVVWDRMINDPTGRDATHAFDVETMKKDDFYAQYPWATPSDLDVDYALRGDLRMNGWVSLDDVRIVKYWRMRTRLRTLAMLTDGRVVDITDLTDQDHPSFDLQKAQEILSNVATRADGSPIMREVKRPYAEMYKCSGMDVLEGPYRLEISRVPLFRVPGWEVQVGEVKHRFGLVRFMKDPQRLHNFWRSIIAERLMQSPRAVWLAGKDAVAGREKAFRESHMSDDPLLIWDETSSGKPERVAPAQIEAAFLQMAEMTTQDLKDVSNIHEANLGMPSNEVSGAAINARQRVSDIGTIIYHDNLTMAQEECGRTMNELMGSVYDTARVVKAIGEDAKNYMAAINQVGKPETDISIGRYAVTVKTGPNYATKRIESVESMMAFINAQPQVAAYTLDLVADMMDWPGAEDFKKRIRMMLPPGLVSPEDMTPEELQRAQQAQEGMQQQQQMQLEMARADFAKTQSEIALNYSRANDYSTKAQLAPVKEAINAANVQSQNQDREARNRMEAVRISTGE
jgi:hypothetical protein